MNEFLPVCRRDMDQRGWSECDYILITGDAYVDHPSFGAAIIGRVLENMGFRVGVIAQPNWRDTQDFERLGRPALGFLVTGGNIDSMVNHYTAAKKPRSTDAYSPGGRRGLRPDRATIVYCQRLRQAFPGAPIIIGGLEASLRRFAHYDYWDDAVRRSILIDSGAHLLLYGMAERSLREVAERMRQGEPIDQIDDVHGTCCLMHQRPAGYLELESYEQVASDKRAYAACFATQYRNQDAIAGKGMAQRHGAAYLVQHPPALPLTQREMDAVYALPYMRAWHPMYDAVGGVPGLEEVQFSLTSSRGCFGACAFCALTFHQGRVVQSRSHASLEVEARKLTHLPGFKGYIHDVGGPTANFRKPACAKQLTHGACPDRVCLGNKPCRNIEVDHQDYLKLLRRIRAVEGVKKVFVRSGIRYDYLIMDKDESFFRELLEHHVSGQLKVAPEHVSSRVLKLMNKPERQVYDQFVARYNAINSELGKKQYLVPYMISSHPGSDLNAAIELAEYMQAHRMRPEQVQDFYPTPGTLSTCMFHTGLDPLTMRPVYVPRDPQEKAMQRALLQYTRPQNRDKVIQALKRAGREDLIGYGPGCLVRPASRGNSAAKASAPGRPRPPKHSNKGRGRT